MTTESKPSLDEMGIQPEDKAEAVEKLFAYKEQMEGALADSAVERAQNGQPSDIRTALKESLSISRTFDMLQLDWEEGGNRLDIKAFQELVDKQVAALGLDPEKFSIQKFHELVRRAW